MTRLTLSHVIFLAGTTTGYTTLSDAALRQLSFPLSASSSSSTEFDPFTGSLLSPILVPRVPGTPGHAAVQAHFINYIKSNLSPDWVIEWHNSTSVTPATGDKLVPFQNLIIKREPPGITRDREHEVEWLTLAAHYDSLYRPEGFIGAVDSAVPCAILLWALKELDKAIGRKWEAWEDDGLEQAKGVQVVLFDGEEAWVQWSGEDSLYGSRALAEDWQNTKYQDGSSRLDTISLFVLLDLLGAVDPTVPSFFGKTHWAYQNMARVEQRLRDLGLLESTPKAGKFLHDTDRSNWNFGGYVEDDHVPFLRKGVDDILHIIPTPFPKVWHTMEDDAKNLDVGTVKDWAKIVTGFVGEWMDLEGHFEGVETGTEDEKGRYSEKDEL
ncbi:putative glutaminyl-peptide cyclotransferase [Triangularia verruculosa]|uniref:Peptide hydrolase n=1 Tax=Triangularia verruculosa TaxID=2587418 RepID=A0AAN6XPA0_9PEZI|nr:putative glutaminyl-peptide cyclotransferase [Triangularia verruculosa]